MDWLHEKLDKIDQKLDRMDDKLDVHLERISQSERDIHWLSGHVKITTGFVLTVVAGIVTWYLTK